VIEPEFVISVESFVGRRSGSEGVKLEQQIVVTDDGAELPTPYPLDL
jgi:Xaa-Pro dipeptidase